MTVGGTGDGSTSTTCAPPRSRLAKDGEHVEAFVQESRRTEVRARAGDVESVTFAESRGRGRPADRRRADGLRVGGRPDVAEVRATVARARENAALATEDEHNVLPGPEAAEELPGLFHQDLVDTPTRAQGRAGARARRRGLAVGPAGPQGRPRVVLGLGHADRDRLDAGRSRRVRAHRLLVRRRRRSPSRATRRRRGSRSGWRATPAGWTGWRARRRPPTRAARLLGVGEAGVGRRSGRARPGRRGGVPRRAGGRAVGRVGPEGPVAVRVARRRGRRLEPGEPRRRRPAARRAGRRRRSTTRACRPSRPR